MECFPTNVSLEFDEQNGNQSITANTKVRMSESYCCRSRCVLILVIKPQALTRAVCGYFLFGVFEKLTILSVRLFECNATQPKSDLRCPTRFSYINTYLILFKKKYSKRKKTRAVFQVRSFR